MKTVRKVTDGDRWTDRLKRLYSWQIVHDKMKCMWISVSCCTSIVALFTLQQQLVLSEEDGQLIEYRIQEHEQTPLCLSILQPLCPQRILVCLNAFCVITQSKQHFTLNTCNLWHWEVQKMFMLILKIVNHKVLTSLSFSTILIFFSHNSNFRN